MRHDVATFREDLVQIALANHGMPVSPSDVNAADDVVQPNRLFAIARVRLESAVDTMYRSGNVFAPNALATSFAIGQVNTAITALRGVNVPSSSFAQRRRASAAIDSAADGVRLLMTYRHDVQPLGDDPFRLDSLPTETRSALDRALELLDEAVGQIN